MPQQKRTATAAFLAGPHNPATALSIDESATLRASSTAERPPAAADEGEPAEEARRQKRRLADEQPEKEKEKEARKVLPEELVSVQELRSMGREELVRYAFAVGKQARPGTDLRAIKSMVEAPAALRERGGVFGDLAMVTAAGAGAGTGELDGYGSESGDEEEEDEGDEDEDEGDDDENEGDEDHVEGGEGRDGFGDGDEDKDEDGEAVDARWTRRKITGWIPTSPPPKPSATQKARRRYRSRKRARRDAERKLKTVAATA